MEIFLHKYWKIGLSVFFGVAVFFFWGYCYSAHLSYQEQFQLFLMDIDYFLERISIPGGIADYIAEYLTQFYYYTWLGALILALLFMAFQRLIWWVAQKQGAVDDYYLLSFLPVIVLWGFMEDEHVMLSFAIALLMVLLVICGYIHLNKQWERGMYIFLFLPLLYWIAGPLHFIFMGWVIMSALQCCFRSNKLLRGVGLVLGISILGFCLPMLMCLWLQYPFYRLLSGLNYYRFPEVVPFMQVCIALCLLIFPFVMAVLPRVKKKILYRSLLIIVFVGTGYYFIIRACDMNKEEAMRYDYWVKKNMWDKIISTAEKKTPDSPFTVTCLNLALAKTGQLGDRMFEFYQNGTEGLLPQFQRDFTSPLPTGEAFYQLGMINTAQRFAFEAMEAIPNFRKSSRCYKRLAETNIINGQYKVASKYLQALSKTLFYRSWAKDAMTYLYNEDKINSHPEWGRLRQLRYTDDFLFSDREIEVMLGLLVEHNYKNKMAFEYMLAYVLEKKDIPTFMKYYPLGKKLGYDHIPRSYQEALVYVWTQSHPSFQGMPWSISPQIMEAIADFARIYTQQPNSESMLKAKYGGTYWYYYLFRNN